MCTTLKFCIKCHKELKSYGFVFEEYINFCATYMEKEQVYVDVDDEGQADPLIAFLESKNFIQTLEVGPDVISIRPNGFTYDGNYILCSRKHLKLN